MKPTVPVPIVGTPPLTHSITPTTNSWSATHRQRESQAKRDGAAWQRDGQANEIKMLHAAETANLNEIKLLGNEMVAFKDESNGHWFKVDPRHNTKLLK
jgi:hypothetical protein